MKRPLLSSSWLRVRLLVARWGPVGVASTALLVAGVAALAWLVQANDLVEQQRLLAARVAALPRSEPKEEAPVDNDNLTLFYRALGERRHAEQQVKTLFALASKAGLVLSKGEYREAFDNSARLYTYQVTLPVKGAYGAIWEFALQSLRTIPFASLDDIGFRRDAIGDASVEARVRFTLYLADRPPGVAE